MLTIRHLNCDWCTRKDCWKPTSFVLLPANAGLTLRVILAIKKPLKRALRFLSDLSLQDKDPALDRALGRIVSKATSFLDVVLQILRICPAD